MTPKGHAIPSKTQLLSYGTPALSGGHFLLRNFAGFVPEFTDCFLLFFLQKHTIEPAMVYKKGISERFFTFVAPFQHIFPVH